MKREFKDIMKLEPYKSLNSEITGDYDEARLFMGEGIDLTLAPVTFVLNMTFWPTSIRPWFRCLAATGSWTIISPLTTFMMSSPSEGRIHRLCR